MSDALEVLEAQAAAHLAYADYPPDPWVIPRRHRSGASVRDVVIVGAGMSGLSVAFLLLRSRITNIRVIDRSPEGREGPWITYARMEHLRTPKELVGPDCGFASLSFPAWFRAQFGDEAWRSLPKAPRALWMEYLTWFRRTAALPVDNDVELARVEPEADGTLALHVIARGTPEVIHTRKLVLATGFGAAGGGIVPDLVSESLPRHRYAHSADDIDFGALQGKRVAVLGAGASAFDNAAVALEAGARGVTLFARRAHVDKRNVKEAKEFSTLLRHYADLDDACRWRLMRTATNDNPPPPPASVARCTAYANFAMHTGARWESLREEGGEIRLRSGGAAHAFDFLILGTGFRVEMRARPELAGFVDEIALWEDRYTPPPEFADPALGRFPYLGPVFEYTPRTPGGAPFLADIHDFGIAAVQSMGPVCVGLNGMKIGAPRLVEGISRSLYLADAKAHEAALMHALQR
jgi:cation diffusion facilitator CzcD-associated flavoprotein CzcO